MKTESNGYPGCTNYKICISLMIFASIQLCWGSVKKDENERILSRQRRYLIFPEGSSLQIVYDTYHPVVDYTNLLVVGITGALAWELPSKPVYPEKELQEIYKNGSLPLLRRSDNYVNSKNDHDALSSETSPKRKIQQIYGEWPKIYDVSHKLQHYLSYNKPIIEKTTKIPNQWNELLLSKNYRKLFTNVPPQKYYSYHSTHPSLGKRSTKSALHIAEEKFNSKLHRESRHALYKRLEKFIDSTGHQGRDCVLKALCETGKITKNTTPRSFLGEILNTIFSLPDVQLIDDKIDEELYDFAYKDEVNCMEKYPQCSQILWKSKFG